MTPEEKMSHIQYCFERARRALDDAKTLFEKNSREGAMNRIYYAMFYAVSALALATGYSTSKHSSLLGWFNKTMIHTGLLPESEGLLFRKSFESRLQGDYGDQIQLDFDTVKELLLKTEPFIDTLRRLTFERLEENR